jgi:Lrp/AsnC family transcriptional regulator, leucine-responsive regulatory protein
MNRKPLDPKDIRLIELLRSNGRMPLVALARELGLSRSAAQERLQRLEQHGVIRGYTALVAWPDEGAIDVWFTIKFETGVQCQQVMPLILAMSEVRLFHALAGDIDGLIRAVARDTAAASALRDRLAELPGIGSVVTRLVLAAHR